MKIKKKILFVNQAQFGYHIDYVQYVKYLKNDFQVTFLNWDYGFPKLEESNVEYIYISRTGSLVARNWRFIRTGIKYIKKINYDLIFIHHFRGCSLLKVLCSSKNKFHLDIRSGMVSANLFKRTHYNLLLFFESCFFKKSISVISEGLRNFLKLPIDCYILPLGANPMHIDRSLNYDISLLYIGTLTGRQLEDTIEGLFLFMKNNPKINIHYTIVGSGFPEEEIFLRNQIKKYRLENIISLEGYIPHNKLRPFFVKCNIGVSYIPITPYYHYQPATKTYEYLLAGMPTLATGTIENRKIINNTNGIIIEDSAGDFCKGLQALFDNFHNYNEDMIRKSVENYSWEKIVHGLKNYINKYINI